MAVITDLKSQESETEGDRESPVGQHKDLPDKYLCTQDNQVWQQLIHIWCVPEGLQDRDNHQVFVLKKDFEDQSFCMENQYHEDCQMEP